MASVAPLVALPEVLLQCSTLTSELESHCTVREAVTDAAKLWLSPPGLFAGLTVPTEPRAPDRPVLVYPPAIIFVHQIRRSRRLAVGEQAGGAPT